jgi:hypothetical protein
MSATITAGDGSGTSSPLTVLSPWETRRTSRNVVHDLIGGGVAVALVAPRPRSGTMALLYPDEASAFACLELHTHETTFELVETDRPAVSMTYVLDGDGASVGLDPETLELFIVSVTYQEVET